MRVISALAIACAIALPAHAQLQQQIAAPTLFSIKGGETLMLRLFGSITSDCVSMFTGFDGIDILDGPPEITLKFEPGQVILSTSGGRLCKPVTGGTIFITATKDISEQMDANLTFRVRFRSKYSKSTTWTYRYHLLMFPAAGEPTTTSNKQ